MLVRDRGEKSVKGRMEAALVACLLIDLLFAVIATVPVKAGAATLFVGGTGPGNYTTIQSAVDAAVFGGTVLVFNGTYYENVRIQKTLSLIGQDADGVVINGGQEGDVISVTADWVNVSGFTVTGTGGIYDGIEVLSTNCHVFGNRALDIIGGIGVSGSGNFIENNTLSRNDYGGISMTGSNNLIMNNNLSDGDGLHIFDSTGNVITGNVMTGTGIFLEGFELEDWNTHTIDTSNTVNGKPVYYWKNADGGTIPAEAGQVILANSMNVHVEGLNTSDASVGIELGFSSYNVIAGNNVSNNRHGIALTHSHDNLITDNLLYSNEEVGIDWLLSYGDTVSNNTISDSLFGMVIHVTSSLTMTGNTMIRTGMMLDGWAVRQWNSHEIDASNTVNGRPVCYWKDRQGGTTPPGAGQVILANSTRVSVSGHYVKKASVGIQLGFSSNNTVTNSTFSDNYYGAMLEDSRDNTFYHNNFIDNEEQLYLAGGNTWDNGYPEGGNYWSDYRGSDHKSGPNQDIGGSDGIGDTPYPESYPYDHYPLIYPFGLPSPPRDLQAAPGRNQIVLTWVVPISDGSSPITSYTVYRGSTSGGETLLVTLGNVLIYTDTGLTNGQTYYYKVTASNGIGEGPDSIEVSAEPISENPDDGKSILEETWFWLVIAVVVIVIVAGSVLILRKRRGKLEAEEPAEKEEEEAGKQETRE